LNKTGLEIIDTGQDIHNPNVSYTTQTDVNGNYILTELPVGSYALTPSQIEYSFTPLNRSVNLPPSASSQNFTRQSIVTPGEMISIPAENFPMGCHSDHNGNYSCSSDELPLHTVYLDAYYIDKYEVTNVQMAAFLNSRGSNVCDGYKCVDLDDPYLRISYTGGQYVVDSGYGNHPVVEVTWYGANAFCTENGKRLPTEAEWEKAARGTTVRAYPWGDNAPTCGLANFWDGKYCVRDTAPVGSYLSGASPYGVLDMAGNVWEWVNDWYLSTYYSSSPANNPTGPASGTYRALRGGSWIRLAYDLRTAYRDYYDPSGSVSYGGFRCGGSSAPGE